MPATRPARARGALVRGAPGRRASRRPVGARSPEPEASSGERIMPATRPTWASCALLSCSTLCRPVTGPVSWPVPETSSASGVLAGARADLGELRRAELLGAVPPGDVADLVPDHRDQLGLGGHVREQAAGDEDEAARQGEGVDRRIAGHAAAAGGG